MNARHAFTTPTMLASNSAAVALVAAALSFGASVAYAQETDENDPYIQSLKACQAMADDAARLSCYDTAVGRVVAASDEGAVRIFDEAEVTKTKRGLFGLNLSAINLFGDGDGENLDLLESTITRVSVNGNTVFITIEEGGAVWRIKNAKSRIKRAKPGDTVVFKKASLGSYFIRINGRTGVKGSRIR